MNSRLKVIGVMLAVIGLAFIAGGGFAYYKTDQGAKSLQAFSAAQNVTLNYNEAGQLVDRGETEGAVAIMSLLTNDWGYTVDTVGAQPERPAGQHRHRVHVPDGHDLLPHPAWNARRSSSTRPSRPTTAPSMPPARTSSRMTAAIGPASTARTRSKRAAREQLWTRTAHALIGELGVGTVTASTLQIGLGHGGPPRRLRRHDPPHRASAWCGRREPRPSGQGSGPPTGDPHRLVIQVPTDAPGPPGPGASDSEATVLPTLRRPTRRTAPQ